MMTFRCSRVVGGFLILAVTWASAAQPPAARQTPKPDRAVLLGKVVELGPYLNETFQIPMDKDLGEATLVLVSDEGRVYPIIKDVRSRGFFKDERLRDRPMELDVHQYSGLPYVRVIDVHSLKGGKRYKVDYWCTVCSIATFEPGPCQCCQDPVELRERPLD